MNQQKTEFERVLSKKDVFALAFGAMIGWGWVVLVGDWINKAGSVGAMLAFAGGGIMVVFVGLTYAELTSAMPKCGGEFVFSQRALGDTASFVCTWAIILGYVSVVAFEAVAFPTVLDYVIPNYKQGFMYTVAGFDVYGTWVLAGVVASILITVINYLGVKPAAFLQGVLTLVIGAVGISLFFGSVVTGNPQNLQPLFVNGTKGFLMVLIATPFMFVGFDVIPQAAEEMNIPFKAIGKIIILSVVFAVAWYIMIIYSVSVSLDHETINSSALVTADAMAASFWNSKIAANILILGGIGGILSSWNSFFVGGSRAIYAMAEYGMLPAFLGKLHPKYKTPSNAILLIGVLSCAAPFFGRKMLVWLVDAGGFTVVIAYMVVALSFLVLRKKEPDMQRPYKVKWPRFVGGMAVLLTLGMTILYLPGMPSALIAYEWYIIAFWVALGAAFAFLAKQKKK